MSSLTIKRLKQLIINSVPQPLKIGGTADDGSDARLVFPTLATDPVLVDGKKMANSLLAEYTVTGSPVTSIDFSGLDINTHKSYRVECDIINPSTISSIYMYINGNTTSTNYYCQSLEFFGSTITSIRLNEARIFSTYSNMDSFATINICKCRDSYVRSSAITLLDDTLHTQPYVMIKSQKTNFTVTNITQLTFTTSVANAIGVGSTIRLYRGDV